MLEFVFGPSELICSTSAYWGNARALHEQRGRTGRHVGSLHQPLLPQSEPPLPLLQLLLFGVKLPLQLPKALQGRLNFTPVACSQSDRTSCRRFSLPGFFTVAHTDCNASIHSKQLKSSFLCVSLNLSQSKRVSQLLSTHNVH